LSKDIYNNYHYILNLLKDINTAFMKGLRITAKELKGLGVREVNHIEAFARTLNQLLKHRKGTKAELLSVVASLLENPSKFNANGNPFQDLAVLLLCPKTYNSKVVGYQSEDPDIVLRREPLPYPVFGIECIEASAIGQMENAMRLPVSLAGALMPDAHEGYGLPIGGVLATSANVVIPYAVGVDIACRMCLSVFPLPYSSAEKNANRFRNLLLKNTIFGVGAKNKVHIDTSVFERQEWSATRFIKQNKDLAFSQLGTSGGGNHFVEWGELRVIKNDPLLGIEPGAYLALLSHSGSRGFGNEVAMHYSRIAMEMVKLPREARHLAWLNLSTEPGQEYWVAMNLAGEYASANHHEIHAKMRIDLGVTPITMIENHHNFAWKERLPDGRTAIIHRKGATPAGLNAIGIIPGSMTQPGYIIKGKGNPGSLCSASHGAGRSMSRSQALKNFDWHQLHEALQRANVELIGGDLDEAPMAYKEIDRVMALQSDLVEILAVFQPRIVRMAAPDTRARRRNV